MSAGRHSAGPRRSMLRTLPTIALQVGVVLALVAGTTAFVALDKRVTDLGRRPPAAGAQLRPQRRRPARQRARALRPGARPGHPRAVVVARGRRDRAGAVRPPGAADRRRRDPHGLDDGAHRVAGPDAAGRPLRRRLCVGLAQPADRPRRHGPGRSDAAPPDLPRRRRPARGDDDRDHGPERDGRGRRRAARAGPRVRRPRPPCPTPSRSSASPGSTASRPSRSARSSSTP